MNETLFNLGFDKVGYTYRKNMLKNRGEKKAKKTKQINKIIEKEREIQKLNIYSIKPKTCVK